MASSQKSKAENKISNGRSSKTAIKARKPRKEDLKMKKKKNKKEVVEKNQNKHKNKSKPINANGNVNSDRALIVVSSSTESLEEAKKAHRRDNNGIANGRTSGTKPKKGKRNQQVEEKEDAKTDMFPMNRIRTIMKVEDPDVRVSEEAVLLVNKATVKFLEQFTREAYACSVQDRKKFLGYQRLSHVVTNKRRYDFLLDFVPEKLKAEDALREI